MPLRSRLFIGHLPEEATEHELIQLFSQAGEVREALVIKDRTTGRSRGFGFVQMETDEEAGEAIDRFHGHLLHGKPIRVVVAETSTERRRRKTTDPEIVRRGSEHSTTPYIEGVSPRERPTEMTVRATTRDLPELMADLERQRRGEPRDTEETPNVPPEEPGADRPARDDVAPGQGGFRVTIPTGYTPAAVQAVGKGTPQEAVRPVVVPPGHIIVPTSTDLQVQVPGQTGPFAVVPAESFKPPSWEGEGVGQPPPPSTRSARLPWLVAAALGVVALAALAFALLRGGESGPAGADQTILIVPFDTFGMEDAGDASYAGYAFAQKLAITLAEGEGVSVLPVPRPGEITGGTLAKAQAAQAQGAGKVLYGSIRRGEGRLKVDVTLIDSAENKILWGDEERGTERDLDGLATQVARKLSKHLGVAIPSRYEYITNLEGDGEMAASPELQQARAALRAGDIKGAQAATKRLVERFPRQAAALALRTHALVLQWDTERTEGNRQAITDSLEKLDATGEGYPYNNFYRAYMAFEQGEVSSALKQLSAILDKGGLAPGARAWVLRYRALARQRLGQLDAALADLDESRRLDPTNPWTLSILAGALLQAGRADEALKPAAQGVAVAPSYWRNHLVHGQALSASGKYVKAATSFGRACELGGSQLPCSLHAVALQKAGSEDDALAAAQRSAALIDTPYGLYNLACYWSLVGKPKKALPLLEQAVKLGFSDPSLEADADLAPLKDDPRFARLVERVKKKQR